MLARPFAIACTLAIAAMPASAQSDPRGVVNEQIAAYQARDIDRFVATFAPDAVVEFDGMRAQGPQQIRGIYALNFTANAPRLEVRRVASNGDRVVIEAAYVFADGRTVCCSVSDYTVRGGKVTRVVATMP